MSHELPEVPSELYGMKAQEGFHFHTSGEQERQPSLPHLPPAAELTHPLQLSLSPQGWGWGQGAVTACMCVL